MLKKLQETDAQALHPYLLNSSLIFVRYRSDSVEEYKKMTKELIEKEQRGEAIIRVILNEEQLPIGQIALYDLHEGTGFLSTWIAENYQGKGINQQAKECFLREVFHENDMAHVYAKIRKSNLRSLKAFAKLPYMNQLKEIAHPVYKKANESEEIYEVFEISKSSFDAYISVKKQSDDQT